MAAVAWATQVVAEGAVAEVEVEGREVDLQIRAYPR
jgi:hypothetical protein